MTAISIALNEVSLFKFPPFEVTMVHWESSTTLSCIFGTQPESYLFENPVAEVEVVLYFTVTHLGLL